MPKVSIIIPAYEAAAYLAEAIQSALAQTWPDKEVIVVDDGSSDATAAIAASIPGVTCLRQANAGVSHARNTGVRHSSGELVAFLDADDVWDPGKLEAQVRLLERYPDCDLVYSNFVEMPESLASPGRPGGDGLPRHTRTTDLESSFLHPFFGTSTVVVRRAAFDRAGGFDESLPYAEDVDFFLKVLVERPATAMIDAAVVYKRDVQGSLSHDSASGYAKLLEVYRRIFATHPALEANHPGMASRSYANLHSRHAASLVRNGKRMDGLRSALRSMQERPSLPAVVGIGRACLPGFLLRAAKRAKLAMER
ncbi:MAG TPA: glycosyltransferase family A protein [Pseudoxanthomonas sp.]|nr:glycosyltransferase family A protein [Pseudoxanthomonas sp.]